MRFIPTIVHGVADYMVAMVVVAQPFVFGWPGMGRWAMVSLGVFAIIYSVCTDYELGALPILSISVHLAFDFVFGVAMLALPWLLDLPKPVAVIGVLAIILVFTTKLSIGSHAR